MTWIKCARVGAAHSTPILDAYEVLMQCCQPDGAVKPSCAAASDAGHTLSLSIDAEGGMMVTRHTRTEAAHTSQPAKHKGGADVPTVSVSIEHAADTVRQGIITSLSSLETIESEIVDLVRKTVSDTLRTSAAAGTDSVQLVTHVVMAAIEAAEHVGTGLTMSIKSVTKGAIMGVHDVGGDVITASSEIMRSVIRHGAMVGADMGSVTRRAVDGLIEATAETGGDIAGIGRKAVQGAIEEAGKVSHLAVKTVKEVLVGLAGSVGETLQAAIPQAALQSGQLPQKPQGRARQGHHS